MKLSIYFSLIALICVNLCDAQIDINISRIDSNRRVMCNLVKQNKLALIADFYTDDAKVDGFDAKLDGISSIKNYWHNIKGKGFDWSWEIFNSSGNEEVIYQTGISHLTLSYGNKNTIYSSLFSVIWKKQIDGEYKIISDSYVPYDQFSVPYYEIEKDSTFINTGNDSLFAIIFKPKLLGVLKAPTIFCLQGGGNVGISNYFYEAEQFARAGIIAVVCDKSGAGKSIGNSSWITQSFEQKVKEYSSILNWVVKQPYVDTTNVGLHGPSEGGRLALSLALANPTRVKFVNAVSAPLETLKENQLYAIEKLLISQGYNYSLIVKTLGIFNEYFDAIKDKRIPEELIERVDKLRSEFPKLYLPLSSTALPRMPCPEDIDYSLGENLALLKCPVYFQYGENDKVVNVNKSINFIPKKKNFVVKIYDNTDHSINDQFGNIHSGYHIDKLKWIMSIINFQR